MQTTFSQRAAAALAILALAASVSHASGRYNLPSTFPQFMGQGFGPGYHAPLVLGVPALHSQPRPRIRRTLHSPSSSRVAGPGFGAEASLLAAPPTRHAPPAYYYAPTPAAPQPAAPAPAPRPSTKPAASKRPPKPSEPRSPSDAPRPEAIPLPR